MNTINIKHTGLIHAFPAYGRVFESSDICNEIAGFICSPRQIIVSTIISGDFNEFKHAIQFIERSDLYEWNLYYFIVKYNRNDYFDYIRKYIHYDSWQISTIAAINGNMYILKHLVRKLNFNMETHIKYGCRNIDVYGILHYTAKYGHIECMKYMYSLSKSWTIVNNIYEHPLTVAVNNNHIECIIYISQNMCISNQMGQNYAAQSLDNAHLLNYFNSFITEITEYELVEKIMKQVDFKDAKYLLDKILNTNMNCCYYSVTNNKLEYLKYFISRKFYINISQCLQIAHKLYNNECVEYLYMLKHEYGYK